MTRVYTICHWVCKSSSAVASACDVTLAKPPLRPWGSGTTESSLQHQAASRLHSNLTPIGNSVMAMMPGQAPIYCWLLDDQAGCEQPT